MDSIYDLSREALTEHLLGLGLPRYRSDQVWSWLYRRLASSFEEMTSLPVSIRDTLANSFVLGGAETVASTPSGDGMATKHLMRLTDGEMIETVLMHYVDPADDEAVGDPVPHSRHTVCLSTQAGCAMGCVFCATGQMGLVRDLTSGECAEQIVLCARELVRSGERLTNVVFMGMGEPLANWPATWETVRRLHDPDAFGLGARRITISTVGIVPGIHRLAEAELPVRLAVSIHAADDDLRSQIVPINGVYSLREIFDACRAYQAARGRRITFEYVLIADVNDSTAQADALAHWLRGLTAHVNLIPLNPTEGSPLVPSSAARSVAFRNRLQEAGISTTLRQRRGIDIQAGCGQLRARDRAGRVGRALVPA
jgi:23S rRNA (adenine2503-C2)-methyltransferase